MKNPKGKIGSRSNLKFIDDIEKDAKTYETMVLRNCARIASEVLESEYVRIINEFYQHYPEPKRYDRTYGMRDDVYKRYYKNAGKVYKGGITLNAQYLNADNYALWNMDYLYNIVIEKGLHGAESVYDPFDPSPIRQLIQSRDSIVASMNMGYDVFSIRSRAEQMALQEYIVYQQGRRLK